MGHVLEKLCLRCRLNKYFAGSKYCDDCKPLAQLERMAKWRAARPGYNREWLKANPEKAAEFERKRKERKRRRRQTDPEYAARQRARMAIRETRRHPEGWKPRPVARRKVDGQLLECLKCHKMLPHGQFSISGARVDGTKRRNTYCRDCRRPLDKVRAGVRRAKEGKFTIADIRALEAAQGMMCACTCGRSLYAGYDIDHVVPLARGGTNWPSNLQLLAPICNQRKGAKLVPRGTVIT